MNDHDTTPDCRVGPAGERPDPPVGNPGCGPICAHEGSCTCDTDAGGTSPSADAAAVVIPSVCTLPAKARPGRVAEFDALFTGALRAVRRPDRHRLQLVLDLAHEATARDLAARERDCCPFFTFAFARHGGRLHLQITVPELQVEVLDALAARTTTALREAER